MSWPCTDLTNWWVRHILHLQMDDVEALNFDDLSAVAKLSREPRYESILSVSEAACRSVPNGER